MKGSPPRKYEVSDDLKLAHEYRIGRDLLILLEGKEVTKVIGYDADEGWIERIVTDEAGHPIVEGNTFKRETLHGQVDVMWRKSVGG